MFQNSPLLFINLGAAHIYQDERALIIGADCSPVAIMELTSEDAALLLIDSENVHLKLKRQRSGVH